jgi:hypothetical protein
MRDASGVHQLQEDPAAPRVDRVGDALPPVDLRHGVDARRAHVAFAYRRRGCAFGDDQAGVRALSVVLRGEGGGHAGRVVGARARHRRHHKTVAQRMASDAHGFVERAHDDFLGSQGVSRQ